MIKRLTLLTTLLLLTACTTPEPYQDSKIPTPGGWARLTDWLHKDNAPLVTDDKAAVEQQWWMHFADPSLNQLIEAAVAGNKNLVLAKARVAEARADVKAARAEILPQINGTGNATRENLGFLDNHPIGIAEADLDASWEFDLFGRGQARIAQAKELQQSLEAQRQGVMVSLLSDVARNYFDLQNNERQIAITQQNLENQQQTLKLTQAQFAGALLSDLDVQRAAAQVSTTAAELPTFMTARDADLNRLSVLTGQPPGAVDAMLKTLPPLKPLDPHIIVAAPAAVLANRPDIRAAERQLAAEVSDVKATTREIFPTINLTAMYGVQDTTLLIARPWTLAAGLTQPILNFGAISSQIDAANARQTQAFASYQETVLEALEDMENALSSYGHEAQRNHSLNDAAQQTAKAADLSRQQFEDGDIPLLDVLVAQRDALAAQSALAASDSLLRQNLVHIYAAAGGGWNIPGNPLVKNDK